MVLKVWHLALVAVLAIAALGGVGALAHGGKAESSTDAATPDPATRAAGNELSSALADLFGAELESAQSIKLARQLGAANNVVSGSVPWTKYEAVAARLRRWHHKWAGVGEAYWHAVAVDGIVLSSAMVRYASTGHILDLGEADVERRNMRRLLKQHCAQSSYLRFVYSC